MSGEEKADSKAFGDCERIFCCWGEEGEGVGEDELLLNFNLLLSA